MLYDQGKPAESKRIATVIRTLTHDTNTSKSLLGQMQLKKKMLFLSTSQKFDNTNLLSQQCLVYMNLDSKGGRFYPLLDNSNKHWIDYVYWNNEIVISDKKNNLYRRKQLIQLLANKDGGAHVDSEISDDLAELKDPNLSGWVFCRPDGKENPLENVILASMRQMAYEILHSLFKVKPQLFETIYF